MTTATSEKRLTSPAELEELRADVSGNGPCVIVSGGTCGRASGSEALVAAVREGLEQLGLAEKVTLRVTGCLGYCEKEPLLVFRPANVFYPKLPPDEAVRVLKATLVEKKPVEELLYHDAKTGEAIPDIHDVPFYRHQQRLVLGKNMELRPESIEDYIGTGGYASLAKVLTTMDSDEVIDCIERSGLRGRGGGGFLTGRKWRACQSAPGRPKYVLCNGDEGDPGAFMDRSIMEGNPHSVLEGMLIGAYAIGSSEGYLYVRAEYPLAVENMGIAIEQAQEYGLLGQNILGSGFDFTVHISRGAGAFVCGESTALMASIEGQVGEPRPKHIHTSVKGLFDKPSNLNNVETWANVPLILDKGAEWFASIGSEKSKGTKVFSLVGKINNTGLVEVPMGITLREVVFDIGGGIPNGRKFKAVQTGGPSGGVIPESLLDLPIDYDSLADAGAMMGSGGMIVMDDRTCTVDVARYFMNFLREESCGKCTPCREGIKHMLAILNNICQGKGRVEDLDKLERLAKGIEVTALCGLGKTAPYPVLSTIKYFRDEYLAHVKDRKCPAGVCTALITMTVDPEKCKACGRCVKVCPVNCISGGKKKVPAEIDQSTCIRCRACLETCPFDAVNVE